VFISMAITLFVLTGCGEKWVSGQNIPLSQLPSPVIKMVNSECETFSENNPQIVSATTGMDTTNNKPMYHLEVKGHFVFHGQKTNELEMNVDKDGSIGYVVGGNKAFDGQFQMSLR
jgi:hypothetical protein